MGILHSAEIRWIVAGVAPAAIKNWFEEDTLAKQEEARVDYYLKFPGDPFIGIKLRKYPKGGQNLEFKPVLKSKIDLKLPQDIVGKAQEWEKWSIESDSSKEMAALLNSRKEIWRAVGKKRWLRKYSADHTTIQKVKPDDRPGDGCNVEFTILRAGAIDEIAENASAGKLFWTLGFEAFNDEKRVQQILSSTIALEFQPGKYPEALLASLTSENSISYPEWLSGIA